jgi:pimeloyl-ACP methyl ester carboxylesterase
VRTVLLAFTLLTVVASAQTTTPARTAAPVGWRITFAENPKLPPVFRQGASARPDGSNLTFFLGNFDGSLSAKKPLLVYIEGSGAQSQFTKMGDKIGYGVFGLIARRAAGKYHVATTEKRGVEFGDAARRGSAEGASAEYQQHATLADRVADVRLLLDTLLGEPQVDATRVILMGHSEGSDVAAAAAAEDPRVTHVAFLSCGGAPQFYDFFIMRRKQMAESGASAEEIEQAITKLEGEVREIVAQPDSESKFWLGHTYKRWASFATHASAESLLRTKARLFLAHGSADRSVPIESFDYLVCELLIHGRENVTIRRYPGRDHSFIKPGDDPSSQSLLEVVDEVLKWADQ